MDWFVGENLHRKPMGFYTINFFGGFLFPVNFPIIQFYEERDGSS